MEKLSIWQKIVGTIVSPVFYNLGELSGKKVGYFKMLKDIWRS